jgi:release factor glutamine methyltransferase
LYIENAKKCAINNNAKIEIIESNLFTNISGVFDIIFFNSVYIPENTGVSLGIDKLHKYETDWCGGKSGTDIIDKYLCDSKSFLKKSGFVLLGFNPKYLNDKEVIKICEKYEYEIASVFKYFLNPSKVFLLKIK